MKKIILLGMSVLFITGATFADGGKKKACCKKEKTCCSKKGSACCKHHADAKM